MNGPSMRMAAARTQRDLSRRRRQNTAVRRRTRASVATVAEIQGKTSTTARRTPQIWSRASVSTTGSCRGRAQKAGVRRTEGECAQTVMCSTHHELRHIAGIENATEVAERLGARLGQTADCPPHTHIFGMRRSTTAHKLPSRHAPFEQCTLCSLQLLPPAATTAASPGAWGRAHTPGQSPAPA